MKKNMLAVLILVVLVVNLTLTAYMIFTVVPNAKRTDDLITKIMQIIDLELESPLPTNINQEYSIEDIAVITLDEQTTNLQAGEDGKAHYAVIKSSLLVNTKDEDYERLGAKIEDMKPKLQSIFVNETAKYTYEELLTTEAKAEVKEKILTDVQALFNSRMIVDITVDYLFQ